MAINSPPSVARRIRSKLGGLRVGVSFLVLTIGFALGNWPHRNSNACPCLMVVHSPASSRPREECAATWLFSALSSDETRELRHALITLRDRLTLIADPLMIETGDGDPESELTSWMRRHGRKANALRVLSQEFWSTADDSLSEKWTMTCPEDARCIPIHSAREESKEEKQMRLLAWPLATSVVVREPARDKDWLAVVCESALQASTEMENDLRAIAKDVVRFGIHDPLLTALAGPRALCELPIALAQNECLAIPQMRSSSRDP